MKTIFITQMTSELMLLIPALFASVFFYDLSLSSLSSFAVDLFVFR